MDPNIFLQSNIKLFTFETKILSGVGESVFSIFEFLFEIKKYNNFRIRMN